jgi:adenine-specific DNA methylase
MKYMGSKTSMLANGLGELVLREAEGTSRVVDLFTGSGAVACFVAERLDVPVLAVDLQGYATALAATTIERTRTIDETKLTSDWIENAKAIATESVQWRSWTAPKRRLLQREVFEARALCARVPGDVVWSAYGGYYFSPHQAEAFDVLRGSLPADADQRRLALGSLIVAAGRCAASPGHTAQPFRPTAGGRLAILEAWSRDPFEEVAKAIKDFNPRFAKRVGETRVGDAMSTIADLEEGDLVIVDPPYSAVHYSRFYHVLETIWNGQPFEPEGAGRYPPLPTRPSSDFSLKTKAKTAVELLLRQLAERRVRVILTFPSGDSSNGLSGATVKLLAEANFAVKQEEVKGRFSTLGGNGVHRAARHPSSELILLLTP